MQNETVEGFRDVIGAQTFACSVRITLTTALLPSTRYVLTIPNGARDHFGALLPQDELIYAFTTAAQ